MKKKIYMMIGAPASGKSTYANQLTKTTGAVTLSSNQFREDIAKELGILTGANDQSTSKEAFNRMYKAVKEYIDSGASVIYDATNITKKTRKKVFDNLNNVGINRNKVEVIAICFNTPLDICLQRNNERYRDMQLEYVTNSNASVPRLVPERVISRMCQNLELPTLEEGFDEIYIYDSNGREVEHIIPNEEIELIEIE